MSLQIYSYPSEVQGLIFDIDKTLYENDSYAAHQITILIERLAEERNQKVEITRQEIRQRHKQYEKTNNGAHQSLGNIFVTLGISIETSVRWREELIKPKDFLNSDQRLRQVISQLSKEYCVMAVTNNPVKVGKETLDALGILGSFKYVFGLDSLMKSKPDPAIFRHAAKTADCENGKMLSIGDRFDIDIAPALSVGMGGIHIESVSDVYTLPGIFADQSRSIYE
jgi:HAD superfamily hydrolase (TIGR01549 family)